METIRPGQPPGICGPVEALRYAYMKDRRLIVKTDYGYGNREELEKYEVSIRKLARSSSLPSARASRLFNLARFLEAEEILELGTALGISAGYLAKAVPRARVVTMEGCPELAALARNGFQTLGLGNVELVAGNFDTRLPEVLTSFRRLDLVFFDGNHRLQPTLDYFRQCLPYAHDNSVFVFDDIHYSNEMEQAWETIKRDHRVIVSLDFFHMGWVLFRKELSREHFMLRYP